MMLDKLLGTSHARAYRFLAQWPGKGFMEAEIVAGTGLSRSAVNLAMRDLADAGLVIRQARGRTRFYAADPSDPVVRQFKVWETTFLLAPRLREIQPIVRRVILFGSAARGADTPESDIDLFIIGEDRKAIRKVLDAPLDGRRVQAVIVSNQELSALKRDDPAFYRQVQAGIALYEESGESA